jgi:23S rRNA (cytidine1920-2'-O)/16S rRNA (cytidine1409-2'-O)-methyltransferase
MARLDQALVARGLARSRTHAASLIAEGKVSSAGQILSKASLQVDDSKDLSVEHTEADSYVSRAGHKLAGALDVFPEVTVAGKRCLDAGASTGGFTEVLLRRGAAHVVAVDVGHDQLVPQLRADDRVAVHEGLNVRYMAPADIGGQALVVLPLALCTQPGGDLVLMVKPQFEIGKDRLGRTGVVNSERERRMAVEKVANAALDAGLDLCGIAASPLPGQDGNVEYFLWIKRRMTQDLPKIEERLAAIDGLLGRIWPNH